MTRGCCILGLCLVLAGGVRPALAQTDEPDSTQATGQGGLADIGRAAEQAAEGDSSAVAEPVAAAADSTEGFTWLDSVKPTLSVDVTANVQQITRRARLSAVAQLLDGGTSTTNLMIDDKDYRQQDRDSRQRNFDTSFSRLLGSWAGVDLRFSNAFNEDRTVFTNGIESLIESDQSNATLDLKGAPQKVGGLRHVWALAADVNDVQGSNRDVTNNRSLASAGATSRWKFETPKVLAEGRFGYDKAQGDVALGAAISDGTTTQDTLGTTFSYTEGEKLKIRTVLDRFSMKEERLDFLRNSSGVIDTVGTLDEDKVGREREVRATDRVGITASTRPFDRIAFNTGFQRSRTETQYLLSHQGLEIRDDNDFDADMTFRYAQAGSLSVRFGWSDLWDDRRTKGSDEFRGRESRINKDVSMEIAQRLMAATDLSVSISQLLTQNIFEDLNNQNDRDQLFDRLDASLTSRAIEDLQLRLAGTLGVTSLVNIDAERVANNKEDRLFEARGNVRWTPWQGLSLTQDYRMQIVFIDFHNSNDRDQFNKQGVMATEVGYGLPQGWKFSLRYSVDFRRNGTRDPSAEGVKYRTDLRRFDHKLLASIQIPVKGLTFSLDTTRGFLRDSTPGARAGSTTEDRGEIRMNVSGSRTILKKATLRVDVERVLAYGPRVRPESEDYWVANSGLVVSF